MSKQTTMEPVETIVIEEEPVAVDLKAERVQLSAGIDARLKAERVQERLKTMPGWALLQGGRGIDRVKDLGTADSAADYAGFVLRQAARSKQEVCVELRGSQVFLALFTKRRPGRRSSLTLKQLDFAAAIG